MRAIAAYAFGLAVATTVAVATAHYVVTLLSGVTVRIVP